MTKRLLLPQGELAQFYDSDQGVRYLACIELRAGGVRGNHYHRIKTEWIYLLQGEARLHLQDLLTGDAVSVTVRAGELACIETGIAHALQTVQPGLAIEFSGSRYDATDTYPHPCTPG